MPLIRSCINYNGSSRYRVPLRIHPSLKLRRTCKATRDLPTVLPSTFTCCLDQHNIVGLHRFKPVRAILSPDKELRYLSTVIVTADVYCGFSRNLAAPSLTLQHWSGVSPYTSPYGFAETCVFVKQSLESLLL